MRSDRKKSIDLDECDHMYRRVGITINPSHLARRVWSRMLSGVGENGKSDSFSLTGG